MSSNFETGAGDGAPFLEAVKELAANFGWQLRSFRREGELAAFVPLDHDPGFEQIFWVHDSKHACLRCLLVTRSAVPVERESAILEMCLRINDGLLFGCAEYGFLDRKVVFRDSMPLGYGELAEVVASLTQRVLSLGSHYSPAVSATVAGETPAEAVKSLSTPPPGASA